MLPDDIKSLVLTFSNLEEMQMLLNFWMRSSCLCMAQWKEILNIHDPCFNDLLALGYQPDYDSEVQTRLLSIPLRGHLCMTNTEFNATDFAISVHLNVNDDFLLYKSSIIDDTILAIDLNGATLQCTVYDINCIVWINHLPSGRKVRLDQSRFSVFRTGFEIFCTAGNGIHCEISLMNHTLQMNDFLFNSLDILFLDRQKGYLDNMNEIIHLLEFV